MLRSLSYLRSFAVLFAALPLTLAISACGDDGNTGVTGTGGGTGTGGSGGEGGRFMPDVIAPEVVSVSPVSGATGASTQGAIMVNFSEAMAPLTINSVTFAVKLGAVDIPGVITYFNKTASFLPTMGLALNATYTATVTSAATDVAGNALAKSFQWSFTTDPTLPKGPAPVLLGAAQDYAILAKSAISNVPTSAITGNLGLSPAAASFITGFSLTREGAKWTSPQVIGGVFSADNDPPTPVDLTTAVEDMMKAYADAAGRPTPDMIDLGAGTIGGLSLAPGLYKWTSSVTIPTDLTIAGAANDVWIFQISGDLKLSEAKNVTLIGGARAKNVVWQVAGLVDLGTTSHAEGVILSKSSINMGTGASINGRLMAQTAVSLDANVVTVPAL